MFQPKQKIHPVLVNSQASIEKTDLDVFSRSVQNLRPMVILEIGTGRGGSAHIWSELFHVDVLITIDIAKKPEDALIVEKNNHYYLWEHDSRDNRTYEKVKNILGSRKIEFLFIDGDHSLSSVSLDWATYSPLLLDGAIVALHDIVYMNKESHQVPIFWEEMKKKYPYVEICSSRQSSGLGYFIYNEQEASIVRNI